MVKAWLRGTAAGWAMVLGACASPGPSGGAPANDAGATADTAPADTATADTATADTATDTSAPVDGAQVDAAADTEADTGPDVVDSPRVPALCSTLPSGPLKATVIATGLAGSEDFAFDGQGSLVARQNAAVVRLDAQAKVTSLVNSLPSSYGLRRMPDGAFLVALPQSGKLVRIDPDGSVADFATGLGSPNGLDVDGQGRVWVTEFGKGAIRRIDPDGKQAVVVTGAKSPNGVVFDGKRKRLFYTHYGEGKVRSVALDDQGDAVGAPDDVAVIAGSALDGLTLDVCRHLYAVDQKGSKVYRLRLDAAGAAEGGPELLATLPKNVANVQWGEGEGWEPTALYAAGVPGTVFRLDVLTGP